MKVGGEPLQQEFNRGYDFILNTYGSAENIDPSKNYQPLLQHGIVIDIDFERGKNYRLSSVEPPFSIYAKIIGEDIDVTEPESEVEKIFYAPLFSMHYLSIPEVGEEILILREGTAPASKGYYVGRINDTSVLNFSPARQYMNSAEQNGSSPEFRYGFTFEVEELRKKRRIDSPSNQFNCFSIPITFGDVVQQGRSQSYVRHSFNRNNKKGVLEQGLQLQQQNPVLSQSSNTLLGKVLPNLDPSIGRTATKSIHFVDNSIKKLGDYRLASTTGFNAPTEPEGDEKSMIANMADEIYNISTKENSPILYKQVLGEKLISYQKENNDLIRNMLEGLSGLAETVQVLLDAFVEHDHALPKIDLKLEKTIKIRDLYRTSPRTEQQKPQVIKTPDRWVRVRTGFNMNTNRPTYSTVKIPGNTQRIPMPPKIVSLGRMKLRTKKQKINFEAIIGGAEDPRFTAPIETDSGDMDNPSSMGIKTEKINNNAESLIDSINSQKERLNNIFNRATDFLSKNQYIN